MSTHPPLTTAGLIRAARAAKGLTQQDLASRAGVAVRSVARWEAGESRPRSFQREAIARVLDVEPSELLAPPAEDDGQPRMRRASDISARDLHNAIVAFVDDTVRRGHGAPTGSSTRRYDSASYSGAGVRVPA